MLKYLLIYLLYQKPKCFSVVSSVIFYIIIIAVLYHTIPYFFHRKLEKYIYTYILYQIFRYHSVSFGINFDILYYTTF